MDPMSEWCQPEAVGLLKWVGEEAVVDFLNLCLATGTGEAIKGNGEVLTELMKIKSDISQIKLRRREVRQQRRAHFDPENLDRLRRPDPGERVRGAKRRAEKA